MLVFEKTAVIIKNEQSMYTGNMGHKTQNAERYTNTKLAQKSEKLSKKYPTPKTRGEPKCL